jgi:hypothetical protein
MSNSKKHLKKKAVFQIFLITFLAFTFTLPSIDTVEAQTQDVCCAETVSGESCVYTDSSNCAPGSQSSAATCEQTSFCKLGCGFDQNDGLCFNNMPKFSCEEEEGCSWTDDTNCNIPQCERGCCTLSNQNSFTTQIQCKQITSQYEDINMTFDENINSEVECLNQGRSFEMGACVSEDGSCDFTTRDACNEENQEGVNATLPLVGFHTDMLCSNPRLGTECAPQHTTSCLPKEDGVYWMDSCGNAENIYSSDKPSSYNNGFILSKEQSCNAGSANVDSATCGNCDYSFGSLCASADIGINPVYGDYACKDLSCDGEIVTVDINTPASQELPLANGESWCAYDGLVGVDERAGLGLDLVGSRHYRRLCINGVELTEPCEDFREQICVQGEIDVSIDPALQEIFGTQESFERSGSGNLIAGACRDNRFQECSDIVNKDDCENLAQRDCLWLLGNFEEKPEETQGAACVPIVPPGLKHWSGESSGQTSKADPKDTCNAASTSCEITYQKPGLGWVGNSNWVVKAGGECLSLDYLNNANSVCKSMGDCGAWYNINGEATYEGLSENLDEKIEGLGKDISLEGNLIDMGNLRKYSTNYEADGSWEQFWDRAYWKMEIVGVTTAVTYLGLTALGSGVGFLSVLGAPFSYAKGFALGSGEKFLIDGGRDAVAKSFASSAHAGAAQTHLKEEATKIVQGWESAEGWGYAGDIMAGINFIMWVWTFYQLADFLLMDEKTETINIGCNVWQAPVGGDSCELCQEDGKECSEYRCKSLGQSCKLVNEGLEDEKCISANVNDVNPPHITVNKEQTVHLTDSINSVSDIREAEGKGFEIVPKIAPFTAVTLVVDTNEFSQCKYDLEYGKSFEEMVQYFGDSIYDKTHEMLFSLPGALAEPEVLRLTNGGEYQLYIKCQDGNGNPTEADYYAKFSIDDGPDFTPPIIEATSILNGAYTPAGINETDFSIYVNEPSNCRWDDISVAYDDMYNEFSCTSSPFPTSSLYYGLYECETTLSGIEDQRDNYFYFKCEDKPSKPKEERNVNMGSYDFLLKGTTGLEITSVDPDEGEELKFNSPTLKIITSGGAFSNGQALCGYNFYDPSPLSSIDFLNTNSSVHEQPFFNLTAGEYNIYINCIDVAGNAANETAEFSVVVDVNPPQIQQIYTSPGIVHVVTDEPSTCEYSVESSFSFGNGIPMTGVITQEHTASREGDTYHLACTDTFGNIGNYVVYF